MKPFKLLIILLVLPILTYGQKIDEVELAFNHSLRIPNHEVLIKIRDYVGKEVKVTVKTTSLNNDPEWTAAEVDTTYVITDDEYRKLKSLLLQVTSSDVLKAMDGRSGKDGTIWKLTYGDFQNKISYQIWSLDYNTKKRGLQQYKEACEYILALGQLEYNKIK